MKHPCSARVGGIALLTLLVALVGAQLVRVGAATPATGTLSPTSSPVTWNGFAGPATSPNGEITCVEGINIMEAA